MKKTPYSFVPILALLLFTVNQVLSIATLPPDMQSQPWRYFIYWLILIVSATGTNLIALYLGSRAILQKDPIKNLSKSGLFYFATGLSAVILAICFYKSFSASDFWILLFPFSHNDFPFAVSMLIWYLCGFAIAKRTNVLPAGAKKSLILLTVWLTVIVPMLFRHSIWGIDSGSSLVWLGALFLLGSLHNDNASTDSKQKRWYYSKTIAGLIFCIFLVLLLLKLEPISQTSPDLQSRFLSSTSPLALLISLLLFRLFKQFTFPRAWFDHLLPSTSWIFLVGYFFVSAQTVKYHLKTNFFFQSTLSLTNWTFKLALLVGSLFLISLLLTFLFELATRLKSCQALIKHFEIPHLKCLLEFETFVIRLLKENWRLLLIIFWGTILTAIQFICVKSGNNTYSLEMVRQTLISSQNQLLLNVLVFVCFFFAIYSLINRFTYSLFLVTGISIFISISEYLKIVLRNEPILPADLSAITSLSELANMIGAAAFYTIIGILIFLLTLSILITHRVEKKYIFVHHSWHKRIFVFCCSALFLVCTLWSNEKNIVRPVIQNAFSVQNIFWEATANAQTNGPIIQFFNEMNSKIMAKPAGYSKAKITRIQQEYTKKAATLNRSRKKSLKNQTVIFVLSESYSNPNRVPNLKVSPNPIPYLLSLKDDNPSGVMLSTGYGGGTANLEWQSLTGLSYSNLSPEISLPYYQLVPQQKIAPAFTDIFDNKIAIHPFTATFYNRINVFKKFGFQKFYYVGSKNKLKYTDKIDRSGFISDQSAYQEALKQAKEHQKGSTFIQLTTMQNHQPYNNYYNAKKYKLSGSAIAKGDSSKVQTFVQGIHYTDWALHSLINQINQIKRPVTLVWYGDHLPGIYAGDSMSKYGLQLHETDYFIYSNQENTALKRNVASPYQFPALALAAGNNKVTPYYALLTDVTQKLPAMNTNPTYDANSKGSYNVFVSQENKIISKKSLTPKQRKLLHDYLLIQYDLTAGKQYAAKWAQQKNN
ncbi:LTA synthase family protein [Liquorilactobacillus oeni]|uniref:Sulfatase N-terminal domain-containing protein n=1 Tax=Liquorilactobacillus oeni DSM 19972 TaxID=1423777 RepID=A0A0R1MH05_9LACO|nr:LTA synthase family protein [Liquorilactobacillus oeni]KRL04482.1 hypothetical protein FD46_GL001612 [Liquorilactobacillus oeni DSM 19972]